MEVSNDGTISTSVMKLYHEPLYPGYFYHLYNRGNNRGKVYFRPDNYRWFLVKFSEYMGDYLDVYAYCLLPNHFHFLVKAKTIPSLKGMESLMISKQLRRFFISYAQAINKQENRVGSLFQKNYKRMRVDNEKYLIVLLYYIHVNPQSHKFVNNFRDWTHSSYNKHLNSHNSYLKTREILNWFGSTKDYENNHTMFVDLINLPGVLNLHELEGGPL